MTDMTKRLILLQIGDFYVYQLNREGHPAKFLIGHNNCISIPRCATTLVKEGVRQCLGCGARSDVKDGTVLTDALEIIKLGLRP